MASTRRLAAILAADVAGYSRLMGMDEEDTHKRLQAHRRELVDPKIGEHSGRVVKNTGDGMLAEFSSVIDAVRCAVELQRAMIDRETWVPEDRRIRFRIGINLVDVIVEDDDIFGDGVNVAARLEALAEPGGICISRVVRDQVRDKPRSLSRIWGSRVSKISRARCGSIHCTPKSMPTHWRRTRRSRRPVVDILPALGWRLPSRRWPLGSSHGGFGRRKKPLQPRWWLPQRRSHGPSLHRVCRSSCCRSPISATIQISNISPTASPRT